MIRRRSPEDLRPFDNKLLELSPWHKWQWAVIVATAVFVVIVLGESLIVWIARLI